MPGVANDLPRVQHLDDWHREADAERLDDLVHRACREPFTEYLIQRVRVLRTRPSLCESFVIDEVWAADAREHVVRHRIGGRSDGDEAVFRFVGTEWRKPIVRV